MKGGIGEFDGSNFGIVGFREDVIEDFEEGLDAFFGIGVEVGG